MPNTQSAKLLEAIESISLGLLLLEECKPELEQLGGPRAVDVAARLNTQANSLYGYVEPLKAHLKSEALEGSPDKRIMIRGESYAAVILRVSKSVLDNEKVRKFLGKKLSLFLKRQDEVRISFEVKE